MEIAFNMIAMEVEHGSGKVTGQLDALSYMLLTLYQPAFFWKECASLPRYEVRSLVCSNRYFIQMTPPLAQVFA